MSEVVLLKIPSVDEMRKKAEAYCDKNYEEAENQLAHRIVDAFSYNFSSTRFNISEIASGNISPNTLDVIRERILNRLDELGYHYEPERASISNTTQIEIFLNHTDLPLKS